MLNSYDAILPITKEDQSIFADSGCKIPMHVTPFGLDGDEYPNFLNSQPDFSVFHLGSMDWLPNLEGINWFLENVYPSLAQQNEQVKVFLAGKKMPGHLLSRSGENLVITGLVADAVKFMSDKPVMVVPLLSGGGMRVKIIEGMMMGKTIISTTIGAEGIACEHLKNILIADTPQDFIKWILTCKNDPGFCAGIGEAAAVLARNKYDNKIIGRQLYNFYENELTQKLTFVN
jgi:glycosyltransferase involved in cell wall biosynthesis